MPLPIVPIERGVLVDLYMKRGLSLARTGAELGVSQTAVHTRMVELGIPRRVQGPPRTPRDPYLPPAEILTGRYLRDVYQRQGITVNAIAAQTGISTATVRRFLNLHRIAPRGRGRHIRAPVDHAQLAGWCRAGVTAAETADRLGCAKSTVYDLLRRFGFTDHPKVTRDIDRDQLAGLRAQGLSTAAIAGRLGCSTSTVHRALVRWAMPVHSRAVKKHFNQPRTADRPAGRRGDVGRHRPAVRVLAVDGETGAGRRRDQPARR